MCGIAGLSWHHPQRLPSIAEVRRMVDVLAHRGPDDSGIYHSGIGLLNGNANSDSELPVSDRGALLGHRRLSIIDLAGGRHRFRMKMVPSGSC